MQVLRVLVEGSGDTPENANVYGTWTLVCQRTNQFNVEATPLLRRVVYELYAATIVDSRFGLLLHLDSDVGQRTVMTGAIPLVN